MIREAGPLRNHLEEVCFFRVCLYVFDEALSRFSHIRKFSVHFQAKCKLNSVHWAV